MNNSLIYMITNTASPVLANGIIPLTTIARRRSRVIQSNGDTIVLNNSGYYKVNVTITFTGQVAGDATIELQKNGATIPGMEGSTTITNVDTEIRQITINGVVRVMCNELATLSLVNTGIAITTSNVSIDIEYLG